MKSILMIWPSMPLFLLCLLFFAVPRIESRHIKMPIQPGELHNATNVSLYYPQRNERLERSTRDSYDHEESEEDDEDDGSSNEGREIGKAGGTSDSSNGYYDFIINEGSYKFWAVFQIFTAALLIYSGFAAVYYAKYNYEPPAEEDADEDILWKRSGDMYQPTQTTGLSSQTFQRIMDALSTKKYS